MKIGGKKPGAATNNHVKSAGDATGDKKTESAGKSGSSGDNAGITLKPRGLSKAKLIVNIQDIRGAKVARIKTGVERGDYNVDAAKVAEKMIERALRNALRTKK